MAKYQQYDEYKDSGVEWLGEIPNSWSLSRIKYSTTLNMGQSPSSEDCNLDGHGYPFLQGNAEFGKISPTAKQYCPVPKKLANKGDLLFSVRAPVGALNIADTTYAIGRGLCSLASNSQMFQSFLWWVLPSYKYQLDAISTGSTFEAVSAEQVSNLLFALPSYKEQVQIANFLDHETAQIDTLIEKQQSLIQLLKEKRQAVISHAVTKGLNLDAPMKDSGVEWLGDVPEHWEVMPLKYAVTFQRGHDLPAQNRTAGDIPLVTSAGISSTHNIAIAKAPGLVTGRYGTIGKFNLLEEDYWPLNTTLYSINLRSNNPKYLWYMLHNLTPIFLANSLKSAVPGVDRNDLHVVKVAMPKNLDEQEALCDYLEKTHCKYDLVIEKASESLILLQERRTALISAAITGKIDVRGW